MTIGEITLALNAMRRFVALSPEDGGRLLQLGSLLAQAGQTQAAVAEAERLLRSHPSHPSVLHFLGTCYAQLGRSTDAERALRGAIAALPPAASAWPWLTLVDLKMFKAGDPDIDALRAAVARTTADNEAKSILLYALGKALIDAGHTEDGFRAYLQGGGLVAPSRAYDPRPARRLVDEIIEGMNEPFFDALAPSGASGARAIFVLGLPRSGTTLVEQILASHSQVSGGAELNLFRTAAMALPGFSPRDTVDVAPDSWTSIGQDYLHLLEQRFGPSGKVVDKTLNHSRLLGLIRHVLPGARFVWLQRDPGDAAWSIFRTRFAQGMDWSWSLETIGSYVADEDRLHAHWTTLYPDDILTLRYEDLVAEPETWMRRLLDHCRLPFEAQVMDFHKTERAVQTASVGQVRQPLYRTSIGGARRYAEHLAPFFKAYEAASRT
ncbi:sulfotransferase [uncultured Caulobacter sp.]|uniref:sulfotransferase n=1 Tax=uncultured Caulobacter sp. TaxID=158749 RepID=UPI002614A66A|nr:sulfotransferase [uncultured Caulobacter sp.]